MAPKDGRWLAGGDLSRLAYQIEEIIETQFESEGMIRSVEEQKEAFLQIFERLCKLRSTGEQFDYIDISSLSLLAEEIAAIAIEYHQKAFLRTVRHTLWDVATSIQFILARHGSVEACETQQILRTRLEKTLNFMGGPQREQLSQDHIDEMMAFFNSGGNMDQSGKIIHFPNHVIQRVKTDLAEELMEDQVDDEEDSGRNAA